MVVDSGGAGTRMISAGSHESGNCLHEMESITGWLSPINSSVARGWVQPSHPTPFVAKVQLGNGSPNDGVAGSTPDTGRFYLHEGFNPRGKLFLLQTTLDQLH